MRREVELSPCSKGEHGDWQSKMGAHSPFPRPQHWRWGLDHFVVGSCVVCLRMLSLSNGLHLTGVSCMPWL